MRKICSSLKTVADVSLSRTRRGEVAADRLFDHDARIRRDQLVLVELVRDVAEQRRRHRQVEGADAVAVVDCLLQPVEAVARVASTDT